MVLFKLPSIASLHRGYRRHVSRSNLSHAPAASAYYPDDTITPAPPLPSDISELRFGSPSEDSYHPHSPRSTHTQRRPNAHILARRSRPRSDLLSSRRNSLAIEGVPAVTDPHWQLDSPVESWSEEDETARLWRRMLELQRRFGCYNSARMNAAVEDERLAASIPPRSCLDLLNDSIGDLPEETQRELEEFLAMHDGPERRRHRFWPSGGH